MLFYIFLFIIGLVIGSFLNVLIDRLALCESIMGRSYCDHCKHKLAWYDLIPVFSFIFLKGECRYCHKKVSGFYPLVELLTAVIFTITWALLPTNAGITNKIIMLAILSTLLVIFFTDLKYQIISDEIQVVFLLLAFTFLTVSGITFKALFQHLLSSVAVMSVILSLFLLTRGRGMGFGDVKLSTTIGLLLGLKAGMMALYLAFIIGAIFGLILIFLKRKKLKSKIAFGPFLVLGIIIMLLFKEETFAFFKYFYSF